MLGEMAKCGSLGMLSAKPLTTRAVSTDQRNISFGRDGSRDGGILMAGRRGQRWVTAGEQLEIRRRVASGEPVGSIAAGLGRTKRTIQNVMARAGSIPPRRSVRSPLRLSLAEREKRSAAACAAAFRSGGSLSGSAARPRPSRARWAANGGRRPYRAHLADAHAADRAHHALGAPNWPAAGRCAGSSSGLLEARWSPPADRLADCATIIPTSRSCGCPQRCYPIAARAEAGVRCGRVDPLPPERPDPASPGQPGHGGRPARRHGAHQ